MMRSKLAGLLATLFVLQLLAVGLVGAPPAVADGAGPIITDPQGDATDVVLPTGGPAELSEPSLDIVAADLAVTSETLTTTVRVLDLTDAAPSGATGSTFRWGFTYAGLAYETRASRSNADGTTQFRLYDATATSVPCPACTGAFDSAADEVTVRVPLEVLNGSVGSAGAPPVGAGSSFKALEVLAQRQVSAPGGGGVTPSADTASTDKTYVVPGTVAPEPPALINADEIGDATVIAVIDFNLVPYHWDFDAAHLPQHRDGDPANDLPLTTSPDQWLSGFPAPSSFSSYDALPITRQTDPEADLLAAAETDAAAWASVPRSTPDDVHFRWIPGTKVIGAVDFGGSTMRGVPDDHGVGVTSVSAGNLHGTCPECLLVFINIATPTDLVSTVGSVGPLGRASIEAAVAWATSQPWIDVVTNSWGANIVGGPVRDNVYGGTASIDATRSASERGQTVFFSAGNGVENGFVLPNTTYFSSFKGPDWMMTVGAVTPPPADTNFSGAGKPVDLSSYGSDYPSAYTAATVSGTGATGFSGTSNATPVVAGIYAKALHDVRAAMPGASRAQADGVVARQVLPSPAKGKRSGRRKPPAPAVTGVACGAARAGCEVADGVLTASELRTRLLEGATPTTGATSVGGLQDAGPAADERFAAEGHGAYRGRMSGLSAAWAAEQERILGPLFGRSAVAERPAGEREWMTVDSACRQHLWGSWSGGYYLDDARTPLPAPDPLAFPLRTLIQTGCPALVAPPTP